MALDSEEDAPVEESDFLDRLEKIRHALLFIS
jgi:hypothetical protein